MVFDWRDTVETLEFTSVKREFPTDASFSVSLSMVIADRGQDNEREREA